MRYNPVVRNFCRIRRILIETLGLQREAVRPSSTFASLVPREQRRRVWERFRQEGLEVKPLHFSGEDLLLIVVFKISILVVGYVQWPEWICLWLVIAITSGLVAAAAIYRWWTVEIDPHMTIGDAALAITTPEQCQDAEYRLNRKEIFFKVRRILAYVAGVAPQEITRETKFNDLLSE